MLSFWKKIDRRFFTYSVAILAAGSVLYNSAQAEELQKLQELEVQAPLSAPFTLSLMGENQAKETLPLKAGQPYLLHLWATWCVPCREELPQLAAFLKAHPDLPIVPVAMDSGTPERVRAFVQQRLHLEAFPVWTADKHQVHQALARLSEPGLPMTLLVDAQGRIRAVSDGGVAWNAPDATQTVTHLLKEAQ
ncbi:redoxin domain-containing protein [Saccharibacter sp. 17.LH.SD]|uniref:TlpA family protein disulfide reductase n=1 Tax=Saccharibacter sp. 17.LH.SD TaxID=2689393 RepID=UPI00136E8867|nr:TlpA family protein disulfide reductase [Saccharibacter sp. 17.LH.SD]MXV44548.1 redoxin domain-containing protein [Saccharibacter sp. 17.LH.SD]